MLPWFEVTVETPPELSEVLASRLFDLGSVGLESIDGAESVVLKAFFKEQPPTDDLRRFCKDAGCASHPGWNPRIQSREIIQEDWAENWKLHFRPIRIGHQLCICPPWDTAIADKRIPIVIQPGMAFGTGQHPTTKGCLELIEGVMHSEMPQRVLDIGTGSGILAIATCKLGAQQVDAIDNDPIACRIASENAAANNCGSLIRLTSSWAKLKGPFDLVIANLFSNLLCDLAPRLTKIVRCGGVLICSGFLAPDEEVVKNAYAKFSAESRRHESGWTTLLMRRRLES